MKYAVFTVSMPDYTPEEAVKKIKNVGYDGVEWRVQDDNPDVANRSFWQGNKATLPLTGFESEAPKWKQMTEKAGLEIPGIATYVKCYEPEKAEGAIKGAAALGAPALRIQVPNYDGSESYAALWDKSRQEYTVIAEMAARHGVKVLVELHHRSIVASANAARRFLDGFDPNHVGAIHDAGNMVIEGWEHPRAAFEALGPYLAHVHMKNARWTPGERLDDGTVQWTSAFCPIPEGIADVRGVMRALRQVGYDGWITFEDFSTEQSVEHNLERNLTYIKAIEQEIAAEA
ncbi:MAG TPA: sugar phosphate isomerase/epimerase family protein [Thermomicrobiales bacterium]|nr:sugar phosphate isomerase/epimerase family protein [Thermomicrobiales bacterium]